MCNHVSETLWPDYSHMIESMRFDLCHRELLSRSLMRMVFASSCFTQSYVYIYIYLWECTQFVIWAVFGLSVYIYIYIWNYLYGCNTLSYMKNDICIYIYTYIYMIYVYAYIYICDITYIWYYIYIYWIWYVYVIYVHHI